jgi:tRNA nucleotidyltransferase (CCA-adding enzyme)
MPNAEMPAESFIKVLQNAYPELDAVREVAREPVYLAGGAIRDLLLGRDRADLDLVVVGDPLALANRLGTPRLGADYDWEQFGTVKVQLGGHEVDFATARIETYPRPGALPVVAPADSIEADLARRDFTINAMAVALEPEAELIDPHGGRADLGDGLIRILHPASFVDDPTRAIRAARYASRFGFALEPRTEELVRAADLGAVSTDRREAELLRLAAEARGCDGLELLAGWGAIAPRGDGIALARRVAALLAAEPWAERVERPRALLAAALGPVGGEAELAGASPERPSRAVELAQSHDPVELVLARALGAEWLDRYMEEWRSVTLEIDGSDLLAAGVPEGPAIGLGLKTALRRKLDGEVGGREQELAAALEGARRGMA